MKIKSIDLTKIDKPIHEAVEFLSIQEIVQNPDTEVINFFYESILFVQQIFNETLDRLNERAKSVFSRTFENSNLKQIALIYLDEQLKQHEVIVWVK